MYDIAVIGAGVVGGMIAMELTRLGMSVCILEARSDVAMGATKANSAIVHAGFDAKEGTLKARLNVRGSVLMEELCRRLGVKYKRNGSLVVGFNDTDRETLVMLKERGEANGVEGLSLVEREELLKLEPNIGDCAVCALVASTGAIVCPYELTIAAIGNAMDNGAELKLSFPVDKIEQTNGGTYRVFSGDLSVFARYVINCAGVYSDSIAALVGDESFKIRPRKGEYMLLDKECGSLCTHTVFRCPSKMGKGILVSPTVDGNLLLGPTAVDIDDKGDLSASAEGFSKIRELASEQVKGIPFGKVITSFSGLRATGSTGDFIIDSPKKGFINVAGIESPGLSSAPAIAEYVAGMLEGMGETLTEKEGYISERKPLHYFRTLSDEKKAEVIAADPAYGHIVCRCEGVSEGEIIEAVRRNPRPTDVDGVKRRTRATMGRCQGGFCTPYIVDILSKELGIDPTRVTKSGGESYLNVGRTKEVR